MTDIKVSPKTDVTTDKKDGPKEAKGVAAESSGGHSIPARSPAIEWTGSLQEKKAKAGRLKALLVGLLLMFFGVIGIWAISASGIMDDPNVTGVVSALMWFLFLLCMCAVITGFVTLVRVPFWVSSAKSRFEDIVNLAAVNNEITGVAGEMPACPSMGSLMHLNRTETIGYHTLTLDQASRSFRNSQICMVAGLGLLALCMLTVLVAKSAPDVRITVAVLGGISTVLSGYITKTFLKAHSEALAQVNRYFNQPLVTGYLLNAERIADTLSGSLKDQALCRVIDQALQSAAQASQVDRVAPTRRRSTAKAMTPASDPQVSS